MKYDQNVTKSHPLSKSYPTCLESINDVIHNEGGKFSPFQNEVALNLDKIKEIQHLDNMCSMDITFGISFRNNQKMLLVEFKLRCTVPTSLKNDNCRNKIRDSITILSDCGIQIHNKNVFIFNDKLLKQSRNILSRVLLIPSAEVLSINELKEKYFD